jgi:hypothetical protein
MLLLTVLWSDVLCLVQTLCINKDVQRLGASSRINEKCLDLQQAKSKASGKVYPQ